MKKHTDFLGTIYEETYTDFLETIYEETYTDFMENIYNYGKTAAKYGIIFYYIWIVYKKV